MKAVSISVVPSGCEEKEEKLGGVLHHLRLLVSRTVKLAVFQTGVEEIGMCDSS